MFKKIDRTIECKNLSNYTVIYKPTFGKEIKVKNAVMKLKIATKSGSGLISVLCEGKVIDQISIRSNRPFVYINITEELINAITKNVNALLISFIAQINGAITFNIAESAVLIDYIPSNLYLENNVYKDIDVSRIGQARVNLHTGNLKFTHSDANIKSEALSLGVSHIFDIQMDKDHMVSDNKLNKGVGKNWKLNLQQYLIRESVDKTDNENSSKIFTYLDGSGNKHIFKEKYFYLDEKKVRHYVDFSKVTIEADEKLYYYKSGKKYNVEKDIVTSTGLTLVSQLEGFKGIKYIQTEIDEIAQVKDNIKQLKNNINDISYNIAIDKQKICLIALTKKALAIQNDIQNISIEDSKKKEELEKKLYNVQQVLKKIETMAGEYLVLKTDDTVDMSRLEYLEDDNAKAFKIVYERVQDIINNPNIKVKHSAVNGDFDCGNDSGVTEPILIDDINNIENLEKIKSANIKYSAVKKYIEDEQQKTTWGDLENVNVEKPVKDTLKYYQNEISNYTDQLARKLDANSLKQLINEVLKLNDEDSVYSLQDLDFDLFFEMNNLHTNMSLNDIQVCQNDLDINQVFRDCKSCEKIKQDYEDQLIKLQNQLKKLEQQVPVHYLNDENGTIFGFASFDGNVSDVVALDNNVATNSDNLAVASGEIGAEQISQNTTDFRISEETQTSVEGEIYRLVMVADKWENVIYAEYNSDNQIVKLTDEKNSIGFEYDDITGNLVSITDTRGRTTKYTYNENNCLIKIVNNDNTESEFNYDADNRLLSIFAPNGYGVKFEYANNKVVKINEVSKTQSIEHNNIVPSEKINVNASLQLTYINSRATEATDDNGNKTVYLFDNEGKPITVYERKDGFDIANAKSFDYANGKVSYSVEQIKYGEEYLDGSCYEAANGHDICGHRIEQENYLGSSFCGDDLLDSNGYILASYRIDDLDIKTVDSSIGYVYRDLTQSFIENIRNSGKKDFVLSAWAKADSACVTRRCTSYGNNVSDDTSYDDIENEYLQNADEIQRARRFELRAEISYANRTEKDVFYASFDWQQHEWQYCALPVVISEDEQDVLTGIRVYFDYTSNTGEAQLRNMSFKEGKWDYSEYNKDGQKIYSENSGTEYITEHEYDDDKKLVQSVIKSKDGKRYTTKYEYDHNNALVRTVDYNGIVNENEYNEKGILVKSVEYHQDEPSSKYYEERVLDEKGKEVGAVNEFGEKVADYTNIPNTDIISVSTDKDGNQIAYGHDHNDDTLLSVSASVDGQQNANVSGYTADMLTKLTHNGFDIDYTYDGFGRQTKVSIAGEKYTETRYIKDKNKKIATAVTDCFKSDNEKETYEFISDLSGKDLESKYNGKTVLRNVYDTYDRIIRTDDLINNTQRVISYDKNGNESKREYMGFGKTFTIDAEYNDKNNVIANVLHLGNIVRNTKYSYDDTPDGKLTSVVLPNGVTQVPVYDKLGRTSGIGQKNGVQSFGKDIYYKQVGDHASELVASEWFEKNGVRKERFAYSYDEKGNIISIKENNNIVVRYAYDSLSRLVREDNKKLDKTTIFAYDNGGNITSRVEYKYSLADTSNLENGYTYNYEYASQGWRDQLLLYNGAVCGEYDNLGNPRLYRGKRLNWSHGRQLDSIGDITYKYNSNGVRIAKTANGVTTKFYLDGTAILAQEVGNRLMLFTRGIDGLNGFTLDGAEYFYKKNIQGDIIAIMDSTGAEIVRYVYDAWGNHKTYVLANGEYKQMSEAQNSAYVEIAQLNPYRYRSYYYDIETSLYYLNTRYYDPEVGRFINADDISKVDSKQINGLNLYAYCFNNPIYNIDPTGHKGKWWQWLIVGVLAVASVALIGFGVGAAFAAAAATVASTATSLTIVASVSVGIGVGGLIGLGTSIDEQGGIKNADPERIYNNMGAGMLTGGVIGFFSGVMSVAGGIVGSYAGFSIGNMTHIASGIKVGKVISTSLLMNSFDFIGRVAGGLMGSAFGEYLSTGNSLTPEEYTTKSAKDELPMWIINILRWLFG